MQPLPVVIVHRNQPARLVDTIDAFRAQDVPVTITVVDNGSAAVPAVEATDVAVVLAGGNLGFGPAANIGYRRFLADGDAGEWVVLAPHDALPEPTCLSNMLSVLAEHPRAGLACADVGDGATPVIDPYFGGILVPARVDRGWEPVGHPHGTLMLARRACLDEVGIFDERYFAYCEEADLALRATAAGWESGLVRGAMVRNPSVGSTSASIDYLQLRNTLLLVREHSGRYHVFIRLCIALWHLASGAVVPTRRGPYWNVEGRLRGLLDFLRGRFGPPPPHLFAKR
ncbi:glycosyl transferase [Parafrankia colletiae]|uniref:Glycosyl transferase n=1 Tax=Parafrankia colletiae TaxID=573497 RepID=A0A1S1QVA2_9ACTN|nr:glycosyltransferase [Parafrankia colletiae]MCK9899063.1 glycosyltransferase [Frankia sp. Cpl3]OHV38638.1 glycosyl transferase [Parafrankia colletiae]